MNKIYTAQEVANRLKIKKTTVYDLIKRGELKASKVGKQLRISQQQLDDCLVLHPKDSHSSLSELSFSAVSDIPAYTDEQALRKIDYLNNSSGLIISSQESAIVEHLRSFTQITEGSLPMLHSYMNDYNSLYSLYYEKSHLALVSLHRADPSFPMEFINALLPGMNTLALHLCDFQMGFYVKKGNPKNIKMPADLCRSDITFLNRERGSNCRMLLDFLLKKEGLSVSSISGYKNELLSHMSLANAIATERADTGIGDLGQLGAYPQLEGVPLAPASMYLLFPASHKSHPAFQAILNTVSSESFRLGLEHFRGYSTKKTGTLQHL